MRRSQTCDVYNVDPLRAELMEIDENLQRAELSPAEEALHIKRRKEVWEKINGPAKANGAKAANASLGRKSDANAKSAFASATSKSSGKSLRTVQVAAQRGDALGADLHRIAGTSLDKGVEMDALIKMDEPERKKVIERAAQGEQVSAAVIGNTAPWQIASRRSFQINRRLTFIGKPCLTQKPKRPWRGFQQR